MSTSTLVADKPYPLPRLIAFSTVGIPLAGMLLVFGLWAPRYYVTLLVKGGMNGAARITSETNDPLRRMTTERPGNVVVIAGPTKAFFPQEPVGIARHLPLLRSGKASV